MTDRGSRYLVKARVAREGEPASLRFIPLETFDLWKSHMRTRHRYQVTAVQISLWVVADDGADEAASPPTREPVVEVRLTKEVGSASMPVERYIAAEELERVLPRLLAHYGIEGRNLDRIEGVELRRGFLLRPEEIFGDDA